MKSRRDGEARVNEEEREREREARKGMRVAQYLAMNPSVNTRLLLYPYHNTRKPS